MKNLAITISLALFFHLPAIAQPNAADPGRPFWVVEYTEKKPEAGTVHIYDENRKHVASLAVGGNLLRIDRRKVRRKLDRLTSQAVAEAAVAARKKRP